MIHSAATKYAIRAVCYLAHLPEGTYAQVREVSTALDIPQPYLSKILQDLGKKGILSSSKGPGGGFRLNCSPTETSLYTVIEAVEGPMDKDECLLGLSICSEDTKCPMHDFWSDIQAAFRQQMASISLLDIVEAEQRKIAVLNGLQQEREI
jgi:Rrf2 family protein